MGKIREAMRTFFVLMVVLFGSVSGSLSSGSQLWNFTTGDEIQSTCVVSSDGKTVFVGSEDEFVYALKTSDGTKVWNYMTLLQPSGAEQAVTTKPILTTDGRSSSAPWIIMSTHSRRATDRKSGTTLRQIVLTTWPSPRTDGTSTLALPTTICMRSRRATDPWCGRWIRARMCKLNSVTQWCPPITKHSLLAPNRA